MAFLKRPDCTSKTTKNYFFITFKLKFMKRILPSIIAVLFSACFATAQNDCATPIPLTSGGQQCGANINVGSFPDDGITAPLNPCNANYSGGEYWFSFVGTGHPLQLSMSGLTAINSGLFVYDDCPGSSPNCIASYESGASTADFILTTPALAEDSVYYIVVANQVPTITSFCMDVTTVISLCVGQTLFLNPNDTVTGGTYLWSGPDGFMSALHNPSIPNVNPATAGVYTVVISVAGVPVDTISTTVVIYPLPIATISSNTPVCQGNTLFMTSSGGLSYLWTGPDSFSDTTQNPVIPNAQPSASGTYTVLVTGAGGCTASAATTVVVNPIPTAVVPLSFSVCDNESVPPDTLSSIPPGAGCVWSNNVTSIGLGPWGFGIVPGFTAQNNGTNPITATVCVVLTLNGCPGTASLYSITVNPSPQINFPALPATCDSTTPTILNMATPAGGTYTGTGVVGNIFDPAISGQGMFTITYTFTDLNGCSNTASQSITVNPPDDPSFNYSPSSMCQTGTDLAATITGGFTGTFSSTPAGLVFDNTSTGLIDLSASAVGTYTITFVTDGPCPDSASTTFIITPPPTALFSYAGPYCQGGTNPAATIAVGSTAGIFSGPGGLVFVNTATGLVDLTGSTPGTYTVTNTIAASGGCAEVIETAQITINPAPIVIVPANITECNSATVPPTAFVSVPPGATFTWTNSNIAIGLAASGTGDIGGFTVVNTGTTPITATITVTPTLDSCPGIPSSYTITVNPTPIATPPPDVIACHDQSATSGPFTSNVAGTTFDWTNSDPSIGLGASGSGTVPVFTGINTGTTPITATITVTPTAFGCTGPDSTFTITINPLPVIVFPPLPILCPTSPPYTLDSATPAGGTYSGTGVSGNVFNPAVSGAGVFTITYTYTDANGCTNTATQSITVEVPEDPTFSITPSSVCQTGPDVTPVITGGGTGTFTFTPAGLVIDDSTGMVDVSASTVGTYSITFTTDGPCPASASASFTITPPPTGLFSYAGPYCQSDPNPSAIIAVGSIPGVFSGPGGIVFVNTSTGEVNLAGSTPGTYTVTNFIAAAGGCDSVTETAQITINPSPIVTVPASITECNSAVVPPTAFVSTPPGATFDWTNSNTAIGLAASGTGDIAGFTVVNTGTDPITATITVTPTLGACPGIPSSYTITVNPTPIAIMPPDLVVCHNESAAAGVFTSLTGGTTFDWTNDNTAIGLGASGSGASTVFTATNTGAGAITATITVTPTANGCVGPDSTYTITVNPLPVVTFPPLPSLCPTSPALTLDSATPAGGTYSGTGVSGNIFNPAVSGPGTFPITYTYTDTNGCTNTATQSITVITPDDPSFSIVPASACQTGVDVIPTITGGSTGTFTFTPAGLVIDDSTGLVDVSASSIGNYTITFTTDGVCPSTATASFSITPPPSALFSYAGPYCQYGTNPFPTFPAGSTAGVFSGPGGLVFANTATGEVDLTGSTPGTYSVINFIAAAGGCAAASDTSDITINPAPTVTVPLDITACNTATVPGTAFVSDPAGGTFAWTNSNIAIGLAASGTGDIPGFTVVNTGNTSITATITVIATLNGCPGLPSSYTITVNPTPNVSIPDISFCHNENAIVPPFISTVSGTTFDWTNDNTAIGLGASGSGTIPGFTAVNTGAGPITATITVTPTASSCVGPDSTFIITINPLPVITFPALPTVCETSPAFTLDSATPAGGTYSGTGVSGNIFNPIVAGPGTFIITYSYTDTNSCTNTATQSIVVDPAPTATFTLDAPGVCLLAPVTATYTGTGGAGTTFDWDFDGGIAIPDTGIGPHVITFDTAGSHTITLTVTYNGCTSLPYSQTVTINQVTASTQVVQDVTCNGDADGQATVNASGGTFPYTYSWQTSPVQDTQTAVNLAPGTYTVNITDDAGCTATASVTIVEPAVLVADITDSAMVVCYGGNTGMAEVTASGGTFPYQYQWASNPDTTNQVTNYQAGNYSVTVTDAHGCFVVVPFSITQNPPINLTMNPLNEGCENSCTGEISTIVSGGIPPYSYLWSPDGLTTPGITDLCAGTYSVIITDSVNCTLTDTAVVSTDVFISAMAGVVIINDITPATVNFTYTGTGGVTFNWDFGDGGISTDQNPSHVYTEDGIFTVTLTVNSGSPYFCEDVYIFTVTIYPQSVFEIPNIFTPNGDGYNDVFKVVSEGLKTSHMVIHNRWGRLVYEWSAVWGEWNGIVLSSGEEASAGVYYYVFDAVGHDDKEYHINGTVTLLR